MFVDFSSLFVKFDPYNASFDKYLLEFISKSFEKKKMEKLFLPHVWFSTDMKKEFYQA
jgi:hypothetical protein